MTVTTTCTLSVPLVDFRRDAARDQAAAAERSRAALKGQLTRTRKRLANGACPCCKRSFVNLHRHMTTKHPDYAETEDL